jgi:hypothetical protein
VAGATPAHLTSPAETCDTARSTYPLGELDIRISRNSTDAWDGHWITVDHVAGDLDPPGSDFARLADTSLTPWVRLLMTYHGRGATGVTPAFHLSEVDFYIVPASGALLLGSVGMGLVGRMRKRRGV